MKFNYSQICQSLIGILPTRQKEVISRRFALKGGVRRKQTFFSPRRWRSGERETLEAIGKDLGITRERVRQIERDAFLNLKAELKKYQKVFKYFKNSLQKTGNLKKEEPLLAELGDGESQNQIYFLLTLGEGFERFGETEDFYSLWTTDKASWTTAQKAIDAFYEKLKNTGKPLEVKEALLPSYLEISKKIQKNAKGLYGLKDWPEINPRKIKDKAYLVLKESQKPLHFTQVAGLIDSSLPQTVHNELIKDPRFVLVGRGIYALKEWGYQEGQVRDVILNVLKTAGRPLKKEEILEKTLEQRLVKENTIFLNLSNKKYFLRNSEGRYTIKEA